VTKADIGEARKGTPKGKTRCAEPSATFDVIELYTPFRQCFSFSASNGV